MMQSISFVEIDCARCGITFFMPEAFDNRRRKDHVSFNCPRGHANAYRGKSEEDILKDRINFLKEELVKEKLLKKPAKKSKKAK